jgi:hypothetical protein
MDASAEVYNVSAASARLSDKAQGINSPQIPVEEIRPSAELEAGSRGQVIVESRYRFSNSRMP